MSANTAAAQSALKLGFFISTLTLASLGARLATADISHRALRKTFDAEGSALFQRHDPSIKQPAAFDILKGYAQGAPLSHWDLTPQRAQADKQAVLDSSEPILPAKPFLFKGGAGDRQAAITCLTQAVYYEAGFEPIAGAQAVAQVVLNRVRHPVFPKSICGVVYQGAALKTGCQFSFTCDGSLGKKPAKGAWDRAKAVAEKAITGFVQKDVGEATHYHAQYVLPWWAPTVTKIAQVGVQIFYRWPGQLGMPGAFNGRYAGNEHVGGGSLGASDAQRVAGPGPNGRVHAIIASAAAAPAFEAPAVIAKAEAVQTVDLAALKTEEPLAKTQGFRVAAEVAPSAPIVINH